MRYPKILKEYKIPLELLAYSDKKLKGYLKENLKVGFEELLPFIIEIKRHVCIRYSVEVKLRKIPSKMKYYMLTEVREYPVIVFTDMKNLLEYITLAPLD